MVRILKLLCCDRLDNAVSSPDLDPFMCCLGVCFAQQSFGAQILATLNIGSWAYMMMPISASQEAPVLQVGLNLTFWPNGPGFGLHVDVASASE